MTRNLKVLGLALVAMLAMGIAAASASAAEFHSEAAETEVSGSQTTTNTFVTDSGTIHCTTATFSGKQTGATATDITITPVYSGCRSTGFIEANVTVDVNGCKYTMTSNETTSAVHVTSCTNANKTIVVTAPFCTIEVGEQTIGPVAYKNGGAGATREITVESSVANIAYHEQGAACKNSGSNTTGGTYTGNVKVQGVSGGKQVGIWYE